MADIEIAGYLRDWRAEERYEPGGGGRVTAAEVRIAVDRGSAVGRIRFEPKFDNHALAKVKDARPDLGDRVFARVRVDFYVEKGRKR